ncbi:membrane-spanning 4-domains subfamily A member 4A-like isoform 1-T1 [Callospermophilus lateralis]|uniref:membrane-spanning 4-domains subfamily A member 4A-like isoform X1 n=2 Tax=Callospermophilus lateralis TaxID=76772 RepID=UPI0040388DDF
MLQAGRSTVSAAVITMRGPEQTSGEGGPALQFLEQATALRSQVWKRMQRKFLKGEPLVLGVVQIIIALIIFIFGIIMMTLEWFIYGPLIISGYTVWGSLMFIISGSFSIAAGKRTTKGMVRSSLGLNIVSSVLSSTGMIITVINVVIFTRFYYYCNYNEISDRCGTMKTLMGLECVVLILSVLEFCIAVSLSAFGCKVICCSPGEALVILPPNPPVTETAACAPFKEV